jgi:hypothetical protein
MVDITTFDTICIPSLKAWSNLILEFTDWPGLILDQKLNWNSHTCLA